MQTVTVDILNNKALQLLKDLELLELIKVRKNKPTAVSVNWAAKYKGAMTKQSVLEIDQQLDELRNDWE